MELWIRSQDRTRLKEVKEIYFDDFDRLLDDECNCLGTYETKERALEVLDEIQKYLTPNIELLDEKFNGKQVCQIGNILTMVYQMPKE